MLASSLGPSEKSPQPAGAAEVPRRRRSRMRRSSQTGRPLSVTFSLRGSSPRRSSIATSSTRLAAGNRLNESTHSSDLRSVKRQENVTGFKASRLGGRTGNDLADHDSNADFELETGRGPRPKPA